MFGHDIAMQQDGKVSIQNFSRNRFLLLLLLLFIIIIIIFFWGGGGYFLFLLYSVRAHINHIHIIEEFLFFFLGGGGVTFYPFL